ncbi:DUF5993 family protein [Shewanella jiangmenensis]|uniref:DUF5993 family protein n=1 Tax=Shewanella jiangmenensis TaxID=2837387 RepID=UPI002032AD69|nr:DUF5993 family protein [Shewanella jiangmenensis]
MSLIFLLFLITCLLIIKNKRKPAYVMFAVSCVATLYWFSFHATDPLPILL